MKFLSKLAALGAMLTTACASMPAQAQQTGLGIPILMVADDFDPQSVKRSSDVMGRVISEIQEQFSRDDWRVIDEYFLAGKKDWEVQDRRPKEQLVGLMELACQDGDDTLCPRAMALIKIRAFAEPFGGATRIRVRVSGDVFDRATNRFLGSWEAPPEVFGAGKNCSGPCAEEVAGDHAREIAISVGTVLTEKLKRYNNAELTGDTGGGRMTPIGSRSNGDSQALVNQYLIHMKNFTVEELQPLTATFKEYPKYAKMGGMKGPPENRRYNYMSYAPIMDVYDWIELTFQQLDYAPGDVHITVEDGRTILIDKIR